MSANNHTPKLSKSQASQLREAHKGLAKLSGQNNQTAKALKREFKAREKAVLREAKQAERAALKAFRHEWSILRRKGLVQKKARDVTPTAKTRKIVREFGHVISGNETAFKVSKKQAERLKKQGITIRNGRAVVSKNNYVRNGKVFNKTVRAQTHALTVNDNETLMQAIERAFRKLKPKYGLAFRFKGFRSYQLFPNAISVYDTLIEYSPDVSFIKENVEFYDPRETFEDYARIKDVETFDRDQRRKARRTAKRRAKKAFPGPGQGALL